MILPTIHSNGTSAEVLYEQAIAVHQAATDLLETAKLTLVEIHEQPSGWRLSWSQGQGTEMHDSAADALAAIRERDQALAEAGISAVTIVTWLPTTSIGRSIVRVVTA